jgi:hypothetical protein
LLDHDNCYNRTLSHLLVILLYDFHRIAVLLISQYAIRDAIDHDHEIDDFDEIEICSS